MYKSGYYHSSDARKCLFTYRQRGLLPTKVSGSLLCRPVGILSNQVGWGPGGKIRIGLMDLPYVSGGQIPPVPHMLRRACYVCIKRV